MLSNIVGFIAALMVAIVSTALIFRLLDMRTKELLAEVERLRKEIQSRDERIEIQQGDIVQLKENLMFESTLNQAEYFEFKRQQKIEDAKRIEAEADIERRERDEKKRRRENGKT